LAIDKSGAIYIADWTGNRVRKVSAGKMSTFAGGSINGYSGDGGLATAAMLNGPQGVAADSAGNVFIADTDNFVIRKVDATGHISTFANDPNFSYLLQISTDAANNLYIADAGACVVWKVTAVGVVSVYAGVLYACGYNGDGISATTAQLNYPTSVTVDAGGNLLIADNGNNRVRQVTGGGISTVAGNGVCDYTGDGGPPTSAELCPYSVAVNKSGAIFVADNFLRVRKIAGGTITTFAGTGKGSYFNGDKLWPLLTSFDDLVAVAVDSKGGVYVLDDVEHRVREIK
jgi:sugar lactone lactonase YvrE